MPRRRARPWDALAGAGAKSWSRSRRATRPRRARPVRGELPNFDAGRAGVDPAELATKAEAKADWPGLGRAVAGRRRRRRHGCVDPGGRRGAAGGDKLSWPAMPNRRRLVSYESRARHEAPACPASVERSLWRSRAGRARLRRAGGGGRQTCCASAKAGGGGDSKTRVSRCGPRGPSRRAMDSNALYLDQVRSGTAKPMRGGCSKFGLPPGARSNEARTMGITWPKPEARRAAESARRTGYRAGYDVLVKSVAAGATTLARHLMRFPSGAVQLPTARFLRMTSRGEELDTSGSGPRMEGR